MFANQSSAGRLIDSFTVNRLHQLFPFDAPAHDPPPPMPDARSTCGRRRDGPQRRADTNGEPGSTSGRQRQISGNEQKWHRGRVQTS